MTRTIQILRGTNAQNNAFTGAAGELTMDTTNKELRIHDGATQGGKVVSVPTGTVVPFAGATAPDGFLICDGSAISRTRYADLFAVIGTTYGAGDGNSTFNLPQENDFPTGVPSDNFTQLSVLSSGSDYEATSNGFFFVLATSANNTSKSYVGFIANSENTQVLGNSVVQYTRSEGMWASCPAHKGQKVTIGYTNVSSISVYFVECKNQPMRIKY